MVIFIKFAICFQIRLISGKLRNIIQSHLLTYIHHVVLFRNPTNDTGIWHEVDRAYFLRMIDSILTIPFSNCDTDN